METQLGGVVAKLEGMESLMQQMLLAIKGGPDGGKDEDDQDDGDAQ